MSIRIRIGSLLLSSLLLLATPSADAGLDAPHNASTATGCLSCHQMTSTYPKLLPPLNHTPLPGDIDDTVANGACWSCHTSTGGAGDPPYVLTHSSLVTGDPDHGQWTVECWVCHNQHLQEQKYNGSTYGKYIRRSINLAHIKDGDGNTLPGKSGSKTVVFKDQTGLNSFADGEGAIDGICEVCHTATTAWQNNGDFANDRAHKGLKARNCMLCHPHTEGFKADYQCLDCHADPSNTEANLTRVNVKNQFSGNSHHVQRGGAIENADCHQCHWEADATGKVTGYHGATPTSAVDLVIYGAGARPDSYTPGSTAIAYTADGSRGQILSLNNHCLGCHDDDSKGMDIFGDGKAPNYYAWDESSAGARDGSSVKARYSRPETTTWGKYNTSVYLYVENKYDQTKALSAHGNASGNQRGWNPSAWESKRSTPDTIYSGGDLIYPGSGEYIFVTRGNGTATFYRYAISDDSWTTMANVPGTISTGADLASTGEYIYALQGSYTQNFYRYSISGNAWTTMAPVPASIGWGGALLYPGAGDYIYAIRGENSTTFYRYSISTNSWTTVAPAPASFYYGADLVYPGTGNFIYATRGFSTPTFFRYSISTNSWTTMANAPAGFSTDGALTLSGGEHIYAVAAGGQTGFFRYSISGDSWAPLSSIPQGVGPGGSLAYPGSGNYLYVLPGSSSTSFYRYHIGDLWPNTSGTAQVACFDCHNSHGSSAGDATHPATSYASATPSGGILKDTTANKGGYGVNYTPVAGGSAGEKNEHNPGAGLCFDCHLTADGSAANMPWGYQTTFEASQAIMGYRDTAGFGNGTFGYQQKYQYKVGASMGGHFGRSSDLTSPPDSSHQIKGLCTPCHDPHGVSPSLGAAAPYAVPLLKGTFMTSPYKEDAAPASTTVSFGGSGIEGSGGFGGASYPAYNIDQNTFANWNWGSSTKISEGVNQFGGLCLKCHPQSVLNPDAGSSNYPWRSMNRVHNTVQGWGGQGLNAGNAKHAFTCSKCHTVHNSQLPRLMITNCLDYSHRGRVTSGGAAGTGSGSGSGSSGSGSGSGRFPSGGYGTGGGDNGGGGGWSGFGAVIACHDGSNGDGWPDNQKWNTKTVWSTCFPFITSPPAVTGDQQQTVLLHMDEASWNGTAGEVQDSSGANNNGTAYFGATPVAGGISGNAGSFNGTALPFGSYISITYAPPMDNFTLEAWIKPTTTHEIEAESTSGTGGTFGEKYVLGADHRGAVDGGAGVSAGTNGISVYEHGDGYMPALAVYSGAISSSQWTHLVVVYSNKRPSIYVNGVLVRTGLQSLRQHVIAPTTIGSGSYGGFPGTIDEVAIYDTLLSPADILLHYQQNSASYICGGSERTITWSTGCSSTSYVDYGSTTSYGQTEGDALPVTNHSVTLSNLTVPATYHYRVRSVNADGEEVSGDSTFTMNTCP